jgi:uncharacterized protein YndB with AHSA1/START domain
MPTTENQAELRLTHRFEAPRERVFEAWTNPEVLRLWFAPGTDWDVPVADVDLREGGRYRVMMREPGNGTSHTVGGQYTEVTPPERIAYTWAWEGAEGSAHTGESLVVVEFADSDGGTEVALTHTRLPSDESRDSHAHGWDGIFNSLKAHLSAG